jgi:Uma2 family endonuclease
VTQGGVPYLPDLALEIQSPGQSDRFMMDKADYYLANGTRMVWLIYTERRLVEGLTPTERHLLTEKDTDTISGDEVLPGFSVAVADIFPAE